MKHLVPLMAAVIAVAALCGCGRQSEKAASGSEPEFWLGADISATTELESRGIFSYNAEGERRENTLLMKELGLNAVRLRVWVDPRGGWSGMHDVLTMAQRAKQHGMAIMIDFHYSDWWADPAKQITPAAWADLDFEGLKQAMAQHTAQTLQLLRDNDIDVKWVQVGNETRNGFMWPMGHIDNMEQYAALTTAGYDAVKSVYPDAIVIVHIDNGYDNELYNRIFDGLKEHGGKWDMIGMSLYPYWAHEEHPEMNEETTLRDCIANVNAVSEKYGCDVMIVETGVEASNPVPGKAFMAALIDAMRHRTGGRCKGVFYWAPECCHGGYKLGAFADDRPTIIMEAFTEAARDLGYIE